ncbi:MAG TPA: hypothetical protein VFE50_21195 [Cyclobacteriaceae bacterium]|nr:hypothetical protein [Cyclobacteriaceae bacterium]
MRNFVSLFSITLFLLVLWRCNPMFDHKEEKNASVQQVKKDLESEKANIAENLRDWSDNIDRRIKTLDEQIGKVDSMEIKKSLRELQTKLRKEKNKVDRSLKEIEKSTKKTWADVEKHSNEVLTEAKIEAQKIEERVEDLID